MCVRACVCEGGGGDGGGRKVEEKRDKTKIKKAQISLAVKEEGQKRGVSVKSCPLWTL